MLDNSRDQHGNQCDTGCHSFGGGRYRSEMMSCVWMRRPSVAEAPTSATLGPQCIPFQSVSLDRKGQPQ